MYLDLNSSLFSYEIEKIRAFLFGIFKKGSCITEKYTGNLQLFCPYLILEHHIQGETEVWPHPDQALWDLHPARGIPHPGGHTHQGGVHHVLPARASQRGVFRPGLPVHHQHLHLGRKIRKVGENCNVVSVCFTTRYCLYNVVCVLTHDVSVEILERIYFWNCFFQLAKIVYRLQFIKLVHNDFF